MRVFLVSFLLVALWAMCAYAVHGEGLVYRPVYYYPVDDDFDGINGQYHPNLNPEELESYSSASMLAGSFVAVVIASLL